MDKVDDIIDEVNNGNVFIILKTEIPASFKEEFLNLLNKLESETNKLYTLEIRGIECQTSIRFKPFNKRSKYIIYDMKNEYKEIEGEYNSIKDIGIKIRELEFRGIDVNNDNWTCPTCKYDKNYIWESMCICNYRRLSQWSWVRPYVQSQKIFVGGGTVLDEIGKLKVI